MSFLSGVAHWSRRQVILALLIGALLIHLPGTWSLPLIDRDEPRFAEASREMLQNGNYSIPFFNGNYRFDKPPLIYWCQVACYHLFGDNEFAARLPSVLAAALTAIAIFLMGERMFNRAAGFWGAAIFLTALQTIVHAKAAVADMAMVFFYVLASWAAWEAARISAASHEVKRPASWWLFCCVALGLGFLTKGPVAWLPIGALLIWSAFCQTKVRQLNWFLGGLLVLAIVGAWGIPALEETKGEFLKVGIGKHVIDRSVVAMEGHGLKGVGGYILLLPLFFVVVFISFLPWAWFLPGILRDAWRRRRALASDELYLWISVLLVFGVFTLVRTKLPHYILPSFPFLALLAANYLLKSDTLTKCLPRVVVGTAAAAITVGLVVVPMVEGMFPSRSVYQVSAPALEASTEILAADFGEPSIVWEFRKKVKGMILFMDVDEVDQAMRKPGSRVCILPTKRIPRSFPNPDPGWKMERISGINLVKGEPVDLSIVIKKDENPK